MKVEFLDNGKVAVEMTKDEFNKRFLEEPDRCPAEQPERPGKSLEVVVTDVLNNYGFSRRNKGFNYVREAIMLAYHDKEYIESVTRLLYPSIAANHSDTPSRVERAIRHAIESARNQDKILDTFGESPCNSEFIAFVVDYLKVG